MIQLVDKIRLGVGLGFGQISKEKYDELFRQYQLVFESAGEGICLVDTDAKLLLSNAAFHHLTGYEKEELLGQSLHRILYNHCNASEKYCADEECKDGEEDCPFLSSIRSGNKYHAQGETLLRKDGTRFLVEYSLIPIVEQGVPQGAIFFLQDITSKKAAEEMLLKSAKLSAVGQLAANVAHEIRNPLTALIGFVKLLEHDYEQQLSEIRADARVVNGASIATVAPIVDAADVSAVSNESAKYRTERNSDNSTACGTAVALCVMDRDRVENRAGHNGHYFEVMRSELERIEKIVDEFLILAKPRKVQFKTVDLTDCVGHVLDLLRAEAANRGISIEVTIHAKLPMIECDENRLKQVLINLIKNAMDAMPSGGNIRITVSETVRFEGVHHNDNDEILISIMDNGQGIPEDVIPKLGEPFYTTKETGTGLGLMVSRQIIESHHGTMEIRSKVGEGTIVDLRIPKFQSL